MVSGNELVGDWVVTDIGVNALQEGFNIKAEGEEFVLRTSDDAAFAEELGIMAVSPRLGRRLAARHNPEARDETPQPAQIPSNLAAVGFAVGGALVALGGTFLNMAGPGNASLLRDEVEGGFEFWIAFIVGGVSMIAIAYVMSIGARSARAIASIALLGVVVAFGLAVSRATAGAGEITAFGFIAGGLVVGVAVLVSGSLRQDD